MIVERSAKDGTKSYLVRVGRRPAKAFSERDWGSRKAARAQALRHEGTLLAGAAVSASLACAPYAERLLVHLERETLKTGRRRKRSTMGTFRQNAAGFKAKWSARRLDQITRSEARDWALTVPAGPVKFAVQLYNRAIEEGLVTSNPFRALAPNARGRADTAPPTLAEFDALLVACSALGYYADHFRAMLTFAAFSGLRPGEVYALRWDDVNVDESIIHVRARVYRGELDTPKSNEPRTVILTPQARDALLPLERVADTIFVSKRGRRLAHNSVSGYWGLVKARSGLDFDIYSVTRHRFVHDAYVMRGISINGLAQQMGWSRGSVEEMLKRYGHGDVGWRDEWQRAYGENVTPLRKAAGA